MPSAYQVVHPPSNTDTRPGPPAKCLISGAIPEKQTGVNVKIKVGQNKQIHNAVAYAKNVERPTPRPTSMLCHAPVHRGRANFFSRPSRGCVIPFLPIARSAVKTTNWLYQPDNLHGISGKTTFFASHVYIHSFLSCLLYTSPSPRDRQKSRMPSSA